MLRTLARTQSLLHFWRPVIFSLRHASTLGEISDLVPRSGKVTLVRQKEVTQNFSLRGLRMRPNESLQIVNIRPTGAEQDPQVVVKLVRAEAASPKPALRPPAGAAASDAVGAEPTKDSAADGTSSAHRKKEKKVKPVKVKTVQISWLISTNDLDGQKRASIESGLQKGHPVHVEIKRQKYKHGAQLSALELESRARLVEHVRKLLDASGEPLKPPSGSVYSSMLFQYGPKREQ